MLLKKSFFLRKRKSCYNTLQQVTMRYKNNAAQGLVWQLLKSSFFSKEGDKLLLGATASYNALQEVTKNRHVHHFKCRSRNLFSEGRGKAVAQGLVWKLLKSSFFF